ncbi:conserved hypothetical protein [Verticillium alfalfae VaMs.102]|uniref:Nuclear membrane fusion protein Kar5 n=1 Tax=Verticillium alfalfae (strain VaMs.102 / ATCC MYA-4576 / FGSC 10136) TaxID=526221 RepID=C9STE7_VERA1|nr:conserved hypothetical protein [Verticillium alfalfae VaMs.102]EEY22062.1 conserved hypothetical protein [Verticillium alfalfae VaMs.102]
MMRLFAGSHLVVLVLAAWCQHISALSWGIQTKRPAPGGFLGDTTLSSTLGMEKDLPLPSMYAVALRELQELETQPLCHRVAARLLVNNCQLLDGKDDATVLIDSGRQVRDFVDSYAASLAICDLERGSFSIPPDCSRFRETVLLNLPAFDKMNLHVSTREIDSCLTALAKSDSAWNTWVSYRHKALRFCEAAPQNVELYKRLTGVLSRLTRGVEAELEKHLQSINDKLDNAHLNLDHLTPRLNHVRDGLAALEQMLSERVFHTTKNGLRDANTLQQLISVLIETVLQSNADSSTSHDRALETIQKYTDLESSVVAALEGVMTSTNSLQEHITVALAYQQDRLEQRMNTLLDLSDRLAKNHENHIGMIEQAHTKAEDILDKLTEASASASTVHDSIRGSVGWMNWWPYIVCPTVSLTMGSYGLPPSAVRNLGLVALGELTGFAISLARHFPRDIVRIWNDNGSFRLGTGIQSGSKLTPIIPSTVRFRNGTI